MPHFDKKRDSAKQLDEICRTMYCRSNYNLLKVGGNFTSGLRAIVACMLTKMNATEFKRCVAYFSDDKFVKENQLYCGEIAHQLTYFKKLSPPPTLDKFFWHSLAVLCLSDYLDDVVFFYDKTNQRNKTYILKAAIDLIIPIHIDYMISNDAERFEQLLLNNDPQSYFIKGCVKKTQASLTAVAALSPDESLLSSILPMYDQPHFFVAERHVASARSSINENVQESDVKDQQQSASSSVETGSSPVYVKPTSETVPDDRGRFFYRNKTRYRNNPYNQRQDDNQLQDDPALICRTPC